MDDIYIRQIDPADRRKALGYLPQDVGLLHGTRRENLNLAGRAITDGEMYAVLDEIGLGPCVRGHALGLDMRISGNCSLSAWRG